MRWLALLLGVCGCDVVFGLDEDPASCSQASFAQAKTTDIVAAEEVSVSWDMSRAVITSLGIPFEIALPGGQPVVMAIGPYVPVSLGLSPEGDSLLFTGAQETPTLYAAVRASSGTWRIDPNVPTGTYAGTPSADAFGPRRVLVRVHPIGPIQEYEDDNGLWKPVGDPHDLEGVFSANLTPNGLTMVYAGTQIDTTPAVFAATRKTTAEWFGPPAVILPGAHTSPQLLDRCQRLYVIDSLDQENSVLREYDL
jgi:hypothetical protein